MKEKYETFCNVENNKRKTIVENRNMNYTDKLQNIIILVHGYQASRQDFQVLKLCLEINFKAKVFISSAN